jgi:hypothetical protein
MNGIILPVYTDEEALFLAVLMFLSILALLTSILMFIGCLVLQKLSAITKVIAQYARYYRDYRAI